MLDSGITTLSPDPGPKRWEVMMGNDGGCSDVLLDGVHVPNVTSLSVSADTMDLTRVRLTIEFEARNAVLLGNQRDDTEQQQPRQLESLAEQVLYISKVCSQFGVDLKEHCERLSSRLRP